MMNLKLGKGILGKGSLNLGGLTFDEERLEMSIDILEMSEDLKTEFGEMIEHEKANYTSKLEKKYIEHPDSIKHNSKWSNEPVVIMASYLQVILEIGKPIKYRIIVAFMDADDEYLDSVVGMEVNLSEYEEELKKVITKALTDRFF